VIKETASLARSGLVQHAYIAVLHEDGIRDHKEIDNYRMVSRKSNLLSPPIGGL